METNTRDSFVDPEGNPEPTAAHGEDPDLALAKLLQEQEHAWFMAVGGDANSLGLHGDEAGEEAGADHPGETRCETSSGSRNACKLATPLCCMHEVHFTVA